MTLLEINPTDCDRIPFYYLGEPYHSEISSINIWKRPIVSPTFISGFFGAEKFLGNNRLAMKCTDRQTVALTVKENRLTEGRKMS